MSEDVVACELCQGSGWSGHPDSGDMCYKCKGAGGYAAANDDGIALALYIELAAYFDPKLTEHDKRIVLDKIKYRTSNTLIEEQAARIAALMTERTSIIKTKREQIESLTKERDKWKDEAAALFITLQYSPDQRDVNEADARSVASQARLSEAVKVLEPLVQYLEDDGPILASDIEILSNAKAFITTLGGEK